MRDVLDLGELHAEVTRKAVRHVHLSVLPPAGKARVAAPQGMALDTIRLFVISKLAWIRSQQRKLQAQERETPRKLHLQVRHGADRARCEEVLDSWYRQQVREAVPALLARWEPVLRVKANRFFVQRMKTKWGSCTPDSGHIRLNTDLAKKPAECLEYIVVHELVHLLEPTHNERFSALLDFYLVSVQPCEGRAPH